MKSEWNGMYFNFVPYKDTDLHVLAAFEDIQVMLEDHIVKTMTMKGSPFIGPFETQVSEWDQQLVSLTGDTIQKHLFAMRLLLRDRSCMDRVKLFDD
jgi:dynein heavy chain